MATERRNKNAAIDHKGSARTQKDNGASERHG